MVEIFVPYRVYQNCAVACEYRGGKVQSDLLAEDKFTDELNTRGFVTLTGEREKSETRPQASFIFVIIAPESSSTNRSQDFKKLVKSVVPKRTVTGPRTEVMLVADQDIKYLINDTEDVQVYRDNNIYLYGYKHNHFLFELPKYASTPQYRLATAEEKMTIHSKFYVPASNLPTLKVTDPTNEWYGFDRGSVLRAESLSETAGKSSWWCVVK